MSLNQVQWAFYAGGALLLVTTWALTKDKKRVIAGNLLLALLTAFAVNVVVLAVGSERLGANNPVVATDQAEMQLRLLAGIESFASNAAKSLGGGLKEKIPSLGDRKQKKEAFTAAVAALEAATKIKKDNKLYPAKLIVVLAARKDNGDESRIKALITDLTQGKGEREKALAKVFQHIYVEHQVSKDEVKDFAELLKTYLPDGWYEDTALTELYATSGDKQALDKHVQTVDDLNIARIGRFATLAVIMALAGLVGVINILVQLGMVARRGPEPDDVVGLDVPLRTVFAVFVGWFCIQIIMSSGVHAFIAQHKEVTSDALRVAFTTFASYLVSNLPGPLLIYFLAIRPSGQKFRAALRLRLGTTTAGPIKVVLMGVLGWCSAIPLVILTGVVSSHFLGSNQHSDNPVIGQIVQAASASNPMAVALFYLTLGVMAPFFEEILFRGFLYGALRKRIGVFLSICVSAGMFSMMHFDKGGVFMLFAIGFVLAFTFERTRSLIPSMIAHGMWNSGSFTFALLLFSS